MTILDYNVYPNTIHEQDREIIRNYFLKLGYEVYDNGLESRGTQKDWLAIRNSDDLRARFKPDLLIVKESKSYFVEIKTYMASNINVLQLLFCSEYPTPVIYMANLRQLGIRGEFASNMIKTPEKYLDEPIRYNPHRKPLNQNILEKLAATFAPMEIVVDNSSRVGDPCARFDICALRPMEEVIKEL